MFINIAPVQIIHGLYCDLGTLATIIPQEIYRLSHERHGAAKDRVIIRTDLLVPQIRVVKYSTIIYQQNEKDSFQR